MSVDHVAAGWDDAKDGGGTSPCRDGFVVKTGSGAYDLRWFTPTLEVDLCGHATLAAAHVLWQHGYETEGVIAFATRGGPLAVTREEGDLIALNFPSLPAESATIPADVEEALGARPLSCGKARDYLFELASEDEVRKLMPDFARLMAWDAAFAVIVTAPGREVDFVSRFFAPRAGVPEDPVTGSAHCTLIPFWAQRLGKTVLHARQVSARDGELFCELQGDRVKIAGRAVTYLNGTITL